MSFSPRDREKLETLDGSRNARSAGRAAVRRSDLASLVSLPAATAMEASGAVTVDQFNALLADYTALRAALDQIAAKVKI